MTARPIVVVAVLLVLLLPQLGVAQPDEDPRKTAKLHVGAFYLTPTLALTNFGVDTNVFNAATGEQRSDFTFAVRPGAAVWLPFARRAMVITKASVDLVYFQKFASERSIDPFVSVRPEIYFNRLTLFAEGSYLTTRQRPNLEVDVRSDRTEEEARVGFDVRVLRKLSLEVAGRERHVRFAGDAYFLGTSLQQTLNRNERALSATARYRWTPLTTFAVAAEAESDRFIYSAERNTDSVRIMPGVELRPRALVSGSAYVGVRRFVGLGDELPDFRGTVAAAKLSYTLLEATRFDFTADRDVQYSFEPTQPYYVQTGFGLNLRHSLGGRFDVMGGAQRYELAYRDLVGAVLTGTVQRLDLTQSVNLGFGYRASRDMRVGVLAGYWERISNTESSRGYNGLRIGLSVEYGF